MSGQLTLGKIREENRYQALKHLTVARTAVRSQLARACGVSTMTIKKVVDDLLQKGLVVESKVGSQLGRKPQALAFADGMGCIACCGLSSKEAIEGRVYDVYGDCLAICSFPVNGDYMESLHGALAQLRQQVQATGLVCIGAAMALPSVYYAAEDRVNNDLVFDFNRLHPRSVMEAYFGTVPLCIMQDVRAGAIAVYKDGPADSLFYLYLGDGVGGTFLQKGEVLPGAAEVAGEVGQCLLWDGPGPQTLEQAACVAGLWGRLGGLCSCRPKDGLKAAYATGKAAADCIDKAAQTAAQAIYNLNWVLNPACFVVECTSDFYAQQILRQVQLLAAAQALPIPNPINIRSVPHGEGHALRGLFIQTQEQWLRQQAGAF